MALRNMLTGINIALGEGGFMQFSTSSRFILYHYTHFLTVCKVKVLLLDFQFCLTGLVSRTYTVRVSEVM